MQMGAELRGVVVTLLREPQRRYFKLDASVQTLRYRVRLQQPLLVCALEEIATLPQH